MNTKTRLHPELTEIKSSYVSQLKAKNAEIEKAYSDKNVSVKQFKDIITNIVMETNEKELDKKSVATKRFIGSVQKATSKDVLLTLVWNARMSGDNLSVLR